MKALRSYMQDVSELQVPTWQVRLDLMACTVLAVHCIASGAALMNALYGNLRLTVSTAAPEIWGALPVLKSCAAFLLSLYFSLRSAPLSRVCASY